MSPMINDDFLEMVKLSIHNTKFEMAMPRSAKKEELIGLNAPVYVIAQKFDVLFSGEAVITRSKDIFIKLVGTKLLSLGGHGMFILDEETHYDFYDIISDFLIL